MSHLSAVAPLTPSALSWCGGELCSVPSAYHLRIAWLTCLGLGLSDHLAKVLLDAPGERFHQWLPPHRVARLPEAGCLPPTVLGAPASFVASVPFDLGTRHQEAVARHVELVPLKLVLVGELAAPAEVLGFLGNQVVRLVDARMPNALLTSRVFLVLRGQATAADGGGGSGGLGGGLRHLRGRVILALHWARVRVALRVVPARVAAPDARVRLQKPRVVARVLQPAHHERVAHQLTHEALDS
eukprot:scaffold63723_cov86-Phaeocystis_antarctica.AAC.1